MNGRFASLALGAAVSLVTVTPVRVAWAQAAISPKGYREGVR